MHFRPTKAAPDAACDTEDALHVLDGSVELWVGDTRVRLLAGMSASLPRGVAHGFNSVGPRTRVVLIQAPHRSEGGATARSELPRVTGAARSSLPRCVPRRDP